MPSTHTCWKKACIIESSGDVFSIRQTNFVNDRGRKCLQHFRLEKRGTRSSETFKRVILFWYVTMLFKTYNQWQEYTENVLRRGSTSLKCSISDWKNKFHK